MNDQTEPKVKSLGKALEVLSYFTVREPVLGVTELAQRMGVTKSNVHNILSTFAGQGYLKRLPDGRYTLGLRLLEYAFVINQRMGYPKAVYDILQETSSQTNEIVYFGLPYGSMVLYLYVVHPTSRMQELPYREMLGETAPLYCTGIGKAILAHLPEQEWQEHLPQTLVAYTQDTITDREAVLHELHRIRHRGYAIDREGRDPNVCCVGVPVYNTAGQLVAGMSTSGPNHVMTDAKMVECANILRSSAARMKERIYR